MSSGNFRYEGLFYQTIISKTFQVWSEYLPGLAIQIRWGFCNLACKVWSEQALRLFHVAECALAIHNIDHNLEKVKYPKSLLLGSVGCSAAVIHVLAQISFTEKDLKFC